MTISLCKTHEISDPGSKSITVNNNGLQKHLFIVHKDGKFHAFINSCPHTKASLDWLENQFLDIDAAFIQCATHDALFEIATGLCIAGPCLGESLSQVKISIINDTIVTTAIEMQKHSLQSDMTKHDAPRKNVKSH